ncbi:putative fatty acyl-CoA reductase [Blattella germanica]|nr:putative fatty acyl-CoA reductase [Blattella germanica]
MAGSISEFYKGKNVFITGGTGFIGRVLIEKLLRSCPDIGNIYVLIRRRKGVDIWDRVDELVNLPVSVGYPILNYLYSFSYKICMQTII